eukprot:CAMPEP_0180677322 /NCGR_PEP_ID=MMETSP1037_2-20121125/67785_1 /TAXON_ID=632150 /ORGANISM="Azadinium spinosum, Strain 3D9" /LENGTH=36 /DNA_ID= /DNA_START= /DNA_END= /DNA_ORIENTATION=
MVAECTTTATMIAASMIIVVVAVENVGNPIVIPVSP